LSASAFRTSNVPSPASSPIPVEPHFPVYSWSYFPPDPAPRHLSDDEDSGEDSFVEEGGVRYKDPREAYAGALLLRSARYSSPPTSPSTVGGDDAPSLEYEYAEFQIFDKISCLLDRVRNYDRS
jgi:hypothetical protein